jgi:hypothetical protein
MIREQHSFFGEASEVRGLAAFVAIGSQIRAPQVFDDDPDQSTRVPCNGTVSSCIAWFRWPTPASGKQKAEQ